MMPLSRVQHVAISIRTHSVRFVRVCLQIVIRDENVIQSIHLAILCLVRNEVSTPVSTVNTEHSRFTLLPDSLF